MLAWPSIIWDNPVTRKLVLWGGLALGLFFGIMKWRDNIQKGVRRQERERTERDQLRERANVETTRREITEENVNARDRANEATAALPTFPDADSLRHDRPDLAAIVFGDDPAGGRRSETR